MLWKLSVLSEVGLQSIRGLHALKARGADGPGAQDGGCPTCPEAPGSRNGASGSHKAGAIDLLPGLDIVQRQGDCPVGNTGKGACHADGKK